VQPGARFIPRAAQVMMRFIASKHNLKAMMNLLIDKSKNIQV
jgi:hypothetical protein